jgi:endonuclease YncB( thermonuclease family)
MIFGPYQGTVVEAHDGDTINVKLDLGFDLTMYARVRVLGINAPELSTPEGRLARDFAAGMLAPGTPVKVTSHGWDKFGGRVDGRIERVVDKADFAMLMLTSNHAQPWDGKGAKPT